MATVAGRRGPLEKGLIFAIIMVAMAALLDSTAFLLHIEKLANDFKVFWAAANSATPYAPTEWPFAYPPTTLVWLKPLAAMPMWASFVALGAVSALAYGAALRVEVGERWPLAFVLFPTIFTILTGQLSMIVAAMAFSAFRTRAAGVILGLAFTIKPQLAFLAPIAFLIMRDWRQLAWFAATVIAASGLAVAWLGVGLWVEWGQSFGHFRQQAEALDVLGGAASPAGFAVWIGLNPLPFLFAGAALALVTLARCIGTTEHKGAMLGLCCILASPYALFYDLVIVLPLVLADLLRPNWRALPAFLVATARLPVVGVVGVAIASMAKRANDETV